MLDNKSMEWVRSLMKGYYQKATGIVPTNIEKREFGFGDFEKKIAYRHYSFKSGKELTDYLVRNVPPFVSYSSAYYQKPDQRGEMKDKGLLGAELVFDLDADDLKLDCKLQHGGKWVCRNCLDSVREETIKLIEDFLIPDFGFREEQMGINFSGNRGYHVHVYGDEVFGLGGDARKNISDYIAGNNIDLAVFFPTLGMKGKRLEGPKPTDYGWGGKLANGIIRAINEGTSSLQGLGIERTEANLLVRKRAEIILGITTGNWDKVNIPKKAEFWANVLKGISIGQSESIDKNVTNDLYHLIRMPNTLHGDTGLIAKTIPSLKELKSFDPMRDAIAFKAGSLRVKADKVPKFAMGGKEYGPYEGSTEELPTCVAAYLVLKRLASVI
ncbi:MAG: DNA primase catalytic subunit PriS [Candidatus Micrarchaeota archaeon]|nr:DNA primase catalytic subunit PriS [Candidatus Micrarchaeota archaeon]